MEQQINLIGSCGQQEIERTIGEIILLTGNRAPTEIQKNAIIDFMTKYMATVNINELKTAFEWSIAGRLGREHERKQAFTMPVIKEVWDTYNKKINTRYNKEEKQPTHSGSQYTDFFREGDKFIAYGYDQSEGQGIAFFMQYLKYLVEKMGEYLDNKSTPINISSLAYDIFNGAGIIDLNKKDWEEINDKQYNPKKETIKLEKLDKNPINEKAVRYWIKYKFEPNHLISFKKKLAVVCKERGLKADAIYFEELTK